LLHKWGHPGTMPCTARLIGEDAKKRRFEHWEWNFFSPAKRWVLGARAQ